METTDPHPAILFWDEFPHHETMLQRSGEWAVGIGNEPIPVMKSTFPYHRERNQIPQSRPHT